MKVYTTEEEQLQALTDWFKLHGLKLLIGLVAIITTVGGWNYWNSANKQYRESASVLYDSMQQATSKTQRLDVAKKLVTNYNSTIYGKVAAVIVANNYIDQKNYEQAAKDYNSIYATTKSWPEFQVVVFENWLRIKLEQEQYQQAYDQLLTEDRKNDFSNKFPLNFYNLKGDILHMMDKDTQAVTAYNKALDYVESQPELKQQLAQFVNWISLKRNDLLSAKSLS